MSSLKPIGSEKLTGQDKLSRIMEIARYKEIPTSSMNENSSSEYSITLADGNEYQIIREKSGYVIKKSISESELDYIEPMKNRKYYSSYSQAFKRLNLLAGELNRIHENIEEVSLFGEQKKFVLKTPKPVEPEMESEPAPQAPPSVPSPELPASPTANAGDAPTMDLDSEMPPVEDEVETDTEIESPSVDVDIETSKVTDEPEMVSFKSIQKLTGKLTQKIRVLDNQDGMTSEEIKYVINMVLSSLDLKNLSPEDKEDILSKFEEAEERAEEEPVSDEDVTSDTEVEKVQADMDTQIDQGDETSEMKEDNGMILNNIFRESKVDKVLSRYFEFTKKELLETKQKNLKKQFIKNDELKKSIVALDKLTETLEQKLSAKKFLEENSDFKLIGKTNKKNLVFENKIEQVKISPEGLVI